MPLLLNTRVAAGSAIAQGQGQRHGNLTNFSCLLPTHCIFPLLHA